MFNIRPLTASDLNDLLSFTNREIGAGYYSAKELEDILQRSRHGDVMCSLLLCDESGSVQGVRFSFAPGHWTHGKGHGLCPEKWPHPLKETAYFQSLFLSSAAQGKGWGGRISAESLKILARVGAKGVVCHSWKESPHGSSTRYLKKLGFRAIAEHPDYWKDVNYNCTVCHKPPCRCTAVEMYLDLTALAQEKKK